MNEHTERGWIGVDLDGTLAIDDQRGKGDDFDLLRIGPPVAAMVRKMKEWLGLGIEVRIFTARVCHDGIDVELMAEIRKSISAWCLTHIGSRLLATCTKDRHMLELWDDRAVQVERNTGRVIEEKPFSEAFKASFPSAHEIAVELVALAQEAADGAHDISNAERVAEGTGDAGVS